ncbi:MAG TPA: hypothetical protein VKD08_07030 [Ignavibacteriaceae bacterium]|nr:hypothetical protein [Ignavibacteriaceae bacterium]
MRYLIIAIMAAIAGLAGCSNNDNTTNPPGTKELSLNISGLKDLGSSAKYEGWLIVNGTPKSTGKFTVDADGNLSTTSFSADQNDLDNASKFVLTIEPEPDSSTSPSNVHILAGNFNDSTAMLSVNDASALNNDFSSASGNFILATPTNGDASNETSGIWFLDISSGNPAVGLNLPSLPSGWKYEGWVVMNGTPATTGKFTTVSGADESAPYSGPMAGPPFPGEDFLNNTPMGLSFPTDLSGGTAVITIEPDPDNSSAPFFLKPLTGSIPSGARDHTDYPLGLNAGTFPMGTATR